MIIIPHAYALALAAAQSADLPVIGWRNYVTAATVTANSAAAGYPASNLANPSTALEWRSASTAEQCVTVVFGAERTVDYMAVARHNWGSAGASVIVEGLPFGGDPEDDGDWLELVAEQMPADDEPALFRFAPQLLIGTRFRLQPSGIAPRAALIYAGPLLVFERGVQPGHTPIPYARKRDVVNPRSQSGEYLGQIVLGGARQSQVTISKLSPGWYRQTLDPFIAASAELPFFWAWAPASYPREVGLAWLTSDPLPVPSDLAGYIDITLNFEALL